jgi:hypothetical protein
LVFHVSASERDVLESSENLGHSQIGFIADSSTLALIRAQGATHREPHEPAIEGIEEKLDAGFRHPKAAGT